MRKPVVTRRITQSPESPVMRALRDALLQRREELGISRAELARRMRSRDGRRVSDTYVLQLERGDVANPAIDTVTRWADALSLNVEITFNHRAS